MTFTILKFMHNIHNVFHIRLSLFLKQLDMNEEDILRITDKLLLRRSFILDLSDVGIFLCLPLSIILSLVNGHLCEF